MVASGLPGVVAPLDMSAEGVLQGAPRGVTDASSQTAEGTGTRVLVPPLPNRLPPLMKSHGLEPQLMKLPRPQLWSLMVAGSVS